MCPVSGGLALAGLATTGTATVAAGSAAIAAGSLSAFAVATVGAAAIGAGIGVATGGVMNLATRRGFFEGAGTNALFGAVGGAGSFAAPFAIGDGYWWIRH